MSLWPIALAAAVALPIQVAAAPWPELPDPPRARMEWIAEDARINGLPSRIERFESELSTSEVLDFYSNHWSRSQATPSRRGTRGEWKTIAALAGKMQIVVQVRPRAGGSEGIISMVDFGNAKAEFIPAELPSWSDVQVLQVMESVDGPKRSELVTMQSTSGFDLLRRRWRDAWVRKGYAISHESEAPGEGGMRTWLATFDKPPRYVDMTVAHHPADGITHISANLLSPAKGSSR